MIRKQVYIDEDLDRALKRLSASGGVSEAGHVRAALRAYVAQQVPIRDDALDRLVGLVPSEDGPTDAATDHDRYLYGG